MKILVLLLSGVGDVLQATPMLYVLRKRFPLAKITVLAQYRTAAEILRNHPAIDELIHFHFLNEGHFKSLRFAFNLRKRRFDVCILAYPANRWQYNLISFLVGARQRIAHRYDIKRLRSLSFLQSRRLRIDFYRHAIEENVKLLELLGVHDKQYYLTLYFPLTDEHHATAARFLKGHHLRKPLVGIHAGSSVLSGMANKRWPKERFAELCDRIAKELRCTLLIFGGNDEEALKRYLYEHTRHKPVLVPEMSLQETGALLKHCRLLVCNDTALMHIAGAVGTKTLVLEGPTNQHKTVPLRNGGKFLAVDLDCRPCYQIGETLRCKYRQGRYDCLRLLTVDLVFREVREMVA